MLINTGERQTAATLDKIKPDHRQRYEWARDQIPAGSKIVDIACGNGYGTFILSQKHHVLGMDISEDAINFAIEHYMNGDRTYYKVKDLSNEITDTEILNMNSILVCFEFIEHINDPKKLLSSLAGKTLFASIPNEVVNPYTKEQYPFHVRHYTPDQFEELLESSGWVIEDWYCQYDKNPGDIFPRKDGRTIIVRAVGK